MEMENTTEKSVERTITDSQIKKALDYLDKLGVNTADFSDSEIKALRSFNKTDLKTFKLEFEGVTIESKARFALRTDPNAKGELKVALFPYREHPHLEFKGYQFTQEDREKLLHDGNLGKVVTIENLVDKDGKTEKYLNNYYLSIDPQTNQLISLDVNKVNVPSEILGAKIDPDMRTALLEGKRIFINNLQSKNNGNTFSAFVQVNADKKGLELIYDPQLSYRERYEKSNAQKNFNTTKYKTEDGIPKIIREVALNDEQINSLRKGEQIYLFGMKQRNDPSKTFQAYVSFDKKTNKLNFDFNRNQSLNPNEGVKTVSKKVKEQKEPNMKI